MIFRPWKPKKAELYVRFYVEGTQEEYIGKKGGKLEITAQTSFRKLEIRNFLMQNNINIDSLGLTDFNELLADKGLLAFRGNRQNYSNRPQKHSPNNEYSNNDQYSFVNNSPRELYEESLTLDPSTAPFKDSTRKKIFIGVDHREPDTLKRGLKSLDLQVFESQLVNGDIVVGSTDNPNRELIIERKTATDFYNGIVKNNHHAHEQSERYFSYTQEKAKEGVTVKVIWIIEAEGEGGRLLYNVLPQVKMMDGMVSYLAVINDQHIIQSYSTNHTVYLIAKLAQAFIEQALFYPVKVNNVRIDKTKKQRQELINAATIEGNSKASDHGVVIARNGLEQMLSVFPSIRGNVAKELTSTGKSFSEIASMSIADLESIKGIGRQSAERIYEHFNLRG